MSGTSLDGVDVSFCEFLFDGEGWKLARNVNQTIPYTLKWREKLDTAILLPDAKLKLLSNDYGLLLGQIVNEFLANHGLDEKVDLIASHGHTVHHRPHEGITVQIGNAVEIAKETGLLVINNFREKDVNLGGQGAPLVPVGDDLLFSEYEACLNLGGIANISYDYNGKRVAFDISPANLPLNKIVRESHQKEFDKNGEIASKGEATVDLIERLNGLNYYNQSPPKSLGVEWLNENFYPIIDFYANQGLYAADVLHSVVIHETDQIAKVINEIGVASVLVTGGGAFNTFFMEVLSQKVKTKLVIPSNDLISFKEAIVFAFLGVLNYCGQINTYKSVTGASRDSIGGYKTYPPQS